MKGILKSNTDKPFLINLIRELDINDKMSWEIKKLSRPRSLSQNALLWLWLTAIENETGQPKNDVYMLFCSMFAPQKHIEMFGFLEPVLVTSSQMDSKQFTDFLNEIKQFAMDELTIDLPEPSEKRFDEFYQTYYSQL